MTPREIDAPTPWIIKKIKTDQVRPFQIDDADGGEVARTATRELAEVIVAAVNAHFE